MISNPGAAFYGTRITLLILSIVAAFSFVTAVLYGASLAGAAPPDIVNSCDPDVTQPSGAIYRFCLPPGWNGGGLLVYAHGYVWFDQPLGIPEDHICFGDPGNQTCINDVVNDLGIAFAATSYPTNGLAVLPAVDDVVELVSVFSSTYGAPGTVMIAGVSEGGLVTALATERHPDVFDGGLAACGPIGSWVEQVNYFGDFRVLFDHFFPDLIPTQVVTIPDWLITEWSTGDYFANVVAPVVFDPANAISLTLLLSTSRAPYVPGVSNTIRVAVRDALAYNVMATNDAMVKLGGNPFDNVNRAYSGSVDDAALNAGVRRFQAAPAAVSEMDKYETSGWLARPLVTLHTSRDQQVPAGHEALYREKVLANHTWMWHVDQPVPVDSYGHCNFDVDAEVLPAFLTLLGLVADPPERSLFHLPIVAGEP